MMSTHLRRLTAIIFAVWLPTVAEAVPNFSSADVPYRTYVQGPWGQIHVRVAGPANGPTILLLHKMFWTSVEFEKVQPLLASRNIRTIAVDLPGYGLSDPPPSEPSASAYADALVPVLNALHARRVFVLGVDTGSSVALAFAVAHPDRVQRLIFDGAPIFDAAIARKLIAAPHFDRAGQPDGTEFSRRWQAISASVQPGALSLENIHVSMLQFFQAAPSYWWAHDAIFKYDFATNLKHVQATGMVLSFRGGALHPQEAQFITLRPDYRLVPIDAGAYLMPSFDAPDAWARAVGDYVLSTPEPAREHG